MFKKKQKAEFIRAVRTGLEVIRRTTPVTAVEWADKHYYLSAGSSYKAGKWKTVPNQVAILNAMGNEEIDEVNWLKSARVGYTKLLCCVIGFFIEHKNRNVCAWQPDDGLRDRFSKRHIAPMLKDVDALRKIFPHAGKKHPDNTKDAKVFSNENTLLLLGAKAAKNFREFSVDAVIYDELSKMDRNIEQEGSPLSLGDTRIEGSPFGKSIRGSTPGVKGDCQITEAVEGVQHLFKRKIPCPECGEFQVLEFGSKDSEFGLKWNSKLAAHEKPESAFYVCKHNQCAFKYADMVEADYKGYWESDAGLITYDGLNFFDTNMQPAPTPARVAFFLWSIYSHFSPWSTIVKKFEKTKTSIEELITFVNTTLGEAWEMPGSKQDDTVLYQRREHYKFQVPKGVHILCGTVDVQQDRLEILITGFGDGEVNQEEAWSIKHHVINGDTASPIVWAAFEKFMSQEYSHELGYKTTVPLFLIDAGDGNMSETVYTFCKKHERNCRPIFGSSQRLKPIVNSVIKKNKNGVFLHEIGTDTAKTSLYSRLKNYEPGEGYIHFPVADDHPQRYFEQLCSSRLISKKVAGRVLQVWSEGNRRNEILDLWVYALACLKVLYQVTGLSMTDLKLRSEELAACAKAQTKPATKTKKRKVRSKGIHG